MARGKTSELADRYTLREAAAEVSKVLKLAQTGNGSITPQGLRKWMLQGHSPYDWDMTAHFGRVTRFPADLLKADVRTWCNLFTIWRRYPDAEQYGWRLAVLNEALTDLRKAGIEARGPFWPESSCLSFDDWAALLIRHFMARGPTSAE